MDGQLLLHMLAALHSRMLESKDKASPVESRGIPPCLSAQLLLRRFMEVASAPGGASALGTKTPFPQRAKAR